MIQSFRKASRSLSTIDDLVAAYQSRFYQLNPGGDLWELLHSYLVHDTIEQSVSKALMSECEEAHGDQPNDFLSHYRVFLSLLFLKQLSGELSSSPQVTAISVLRRFERLGFWDTFQLPSALLEVGVYLLGESRQLRELHPFITGTLFKEMGIHSVDGAIPQPEIGAQLALAWIYLGIVYREETWLRYGIKGACSLLEMCDSQGRIFFGLWVRESEFRPATLCAYYKLLCAVVMHLSSEKRFESCFRALSMEFSSFSDEELKALDPFPIIWTLAFQQLEKEHVLTKIDREASSKQNIDLATGFLRYDYEDLSLACSASGINTGLGALHREKVQIVSFGPHFYPLADSQRYGFYRTCSNNQGSFEDIVAKCTSKECHFKGWSRLISPDAVETSCCHFSSAYPGDQWMWFDLSAIGDRVDLTVKFPHLQEDMPLSFVFFMTAKQILITGEKPLVSGVIDRFQGKSIPVRAVSECEEIKIIPKEIEADMQVIPLAGGKHFWGSGFLLAFSLEKRINQLSWSIL